MRSSTFSAVAFMAAGALALPTGSSWIPSFPAFAAPGASPYLSAAAPVPVAPSPAAPSPATYSAPATSAAATYAAPSSVASSSTAPSSTAVVASAGPTTGNTYTLHITNKCPETKSLATYQITPSFAMNQLSSPITLAQGQSGTITVPFEELGVRLSCNADLPISEQWSPQALVEFGYSAFNGLIGTAYDLSMMGGTDQTNSISVCPTDSACSSNCKTHIAGTTSSVSQLWTNQNQVTSGSPADTVCMSGKTDFTVVYCPTS